MVKLEKPIPKLISGAGQKNGAPKKNLNKVEKSKKPKQNADIKQKKLNLIQENVGNVEIFTPLQNPKNGPGSERRNFQKKHKNVTKVTPKTLEGNAAFKAEGKPLKPQQKKGAKGGNGGVKRSGPPRPLVLAPRPSPTKPKKGSAKPQKPKVNKKIEKQQKEKKQKLYFESLPFDEESYNKIVELSNVEQMFGSLKTILETEKAKTNKKNAIFSDYRYLMTVGLFKIPTCPKRIVKLNLKHSLVAKDDETVLVVPDLQRGAKVDYEATKQHYEELLREAGVTGLTVVPFNQMRTEFKSFEALRKFSNTYDYFLCDGRIIGHLTSLVGSVFQKPRTTFHTVRFNKNGKLKKEIETAMRRTAFRQLLKSDTLSIPIGNQDFTPEQLAENLLSVMSQLKDLSIGGLPNVRNIYITIDIVGTTALPVYVSTAEPPTEAPYVVGPREKRMLALKKEANTLLSRFNLSKDGKFIELSKDKVERKRKLKEALAQLLTENGGHVPLDAETTDQTDEEAILPPAKKVKKENRVEVEKGTENGKKNDNDGNDDKIAIPAKKAKKGEKNSTELKKKPEINIRGVDEEVDDDDEDATDDGDIAIGDEDDDDDDADFDSEDDDDDNEDDDDDDDDDEDDDEDDDDDDDEDDDGDEEDKDDGKIAVVTKKKKIVEAQVTSTGNNDSSNGEEDSDSDAGEDDGSDDSEDDDESSMPAKKPINSNLQMKKATNAVNRIIGANDKKAKKNVKVQEQKNNKEEQTKQVNQKAADWRKKGGNNKEFGASARKDFQNKPKFQNNKNFKPPQKGKNASVGKKPFKKQK